MNQLFYPFKKIYLGILFIFLIKCLWGNNPHCVICLQSLGKRYSIDAWGNPFHTIHENEGVFCHSCSRILSANITQGGYQYPDGRNLCSLCQASAVNTDNMLTNSYKSVLLQLKAVGIINIANNIPIFLVNLHELNKTVGDQNHVKLKGFTKINHKEMLEQNRYNISILYGLPKVEFEAVLAHELIHVWIDLHNIKLSKEEEEGFCNLGSQLIYQNDKTKFSSLHLKAMNNNIDPIYGKGYKNMKELLKEKGWKKLIKFLLN